MENQVEPGVARVETISVQVTKFMAARREKIFAAWTRPDLLARWFWPKLEAEVDLRVGGRFRFATVLSFGPLVASGTYREIVPNERLVFTWNWEEGGGEVPETLVTVEFRQVEGGTEVVVTHEGNPTLQIAENHKQGWNDCEDRLVNLAPALDR